jgi:tellurite resistance-related uncharacterized protein
MSIQRIDPISNRLASGASSLRTQARCEPTTQSRPLQRKKKEKKIDFQMIVVLFTIAAALLAALALFLALKRKRVTVRWVGTAPLPDDVRCYSQTKMFTASSVPKGLLRDHSTGARTWGQIVVDSGRLLYTIASTGEQYELHAGLVGITQPQEKHSVKPLSGDLSFRVKFHSNDPNRVSKM